MPTLPDDDCIDTTPAGCDPDGPAATAAASDDDARPDDEDDEPWSDEDDEASAPLPLVDVSTRDRWLQSALRALVAPALVVDGKIGPRTTKAVEDFQRKAPSLGVGRLAIDGIAGPKTIAALKTLTRTKAPVDGAAPAPRPEPPREDAPPAADGPLVVREVVVNGVTEYHIRAGDQEVSFSYWTPRWRNYKPYNVSRYKGARKNLLTDADIARVGYSRSDIAILKANSLKESGGAYGAINTWDDQIVSWGMAQFAGRAGTLALLLASLKNGARTRARFDRWFRAQGIDVDQGRYPWKDGTRMGTHVLITADGKQYRGDEGWQYLRTQPRLIGAFLLAGNDPAIQLGQLEFWRARFLLRAIDVKVTFPSGKRGPIRRYITSERGMAIVVRLYNWMPAYVARWSDRFMAELQRESPGRDLSDPESWDRALEDAFIAKMSNERKKVKRGGYDDYALSLSRERGSYVSGSPG